MATITDSFHTDTGATRFGHRWGWLLALGIVQIIAGCIAIAVPVIASLAAVGIFGAVLLVTGIMQLIHAFKVRAWPRSAWYGLGGVLYVIAGLLVVAYPLGGALTLAILIAILFIADGTLRTVFGLTVRPVPGWGWLVAAGFASILVGVILLLGWPGTALWATGLLLGVNLIFGGIMNTTLALASRTTASPEIRRGA
jgi:membrane protein HdeD